MKHYGITVPENLMVRLNKSARRKSMSVSGLIKKILREYVQDEEEPKKAKRGNYDER